MGKLKIQKDNMKLFLFFPYIQNHVDNSFKWTTDYHKSWINLVIVSNSKSAKLMSTTQIIKDAGVDNECSTLFKFIKLDYKSKLYKVHLK